MYGLVTMSTLLAEIRRLQSKVECLDNLALTQRELSASMAKVVAEVADTRAQVVRIIPEVKELIAPIVAAIEALGARSSASLVTSLTAIGEIETSSVRSTSSLPKTKKKSFQKIRDLKVFGKLIPFRLIQSCVLNSPT